MDEWVLSLDVGTTSVKAAAVTLQGQLLASTTASYSTRRPRPNVVEHDPEDWWRAVVRATAELVGRPDVEPRALIAVGLSGMAATHVLLDDGGQLLGPAIIWQDTRATEEAAYLNERLGADGVREALGRGLELTPSMQAARMLWLHRHAPDLLDRTRHILGAKDFLLYRLTGELVSDRTSCSGFCHILTGALHPQMAEATGIGEDRLPPRREPTEIGGRVGDGGGKCHGHPGRHSRGRRDDRLLVQHPRGRGHATWRRLRYRRYCRGRRRGRRQRIGPGPHDRHSAS
jgi:xylulokinase